MSGSILADKCWLHLSPLSPCFPSVLPWHLTDKCVAPCVWRRDGFQRWHAAFTTKQPFSGALGGSLSPECFLFYTLIEGFMPADLQHWMVRLGHCFIHCKRRTVSELLLKCRLHMSCMNPWKLSGFNDVLFSTFGEILFYCSFVVFTLAMCHFESIGWSPNRLKKTLLCVTYSEIHIFLTMDPETMLSGWCSRIKGLLSLANQFLVSGLLSGNKWKLTHAAQPLADFLFSSNFFFPPRQLKSTREQRWSSAYKIRRFFFLCMRVHVCWTSPVSTKRSEGGWYVAEVHHSHLPVCQTSCLAELHTEMVLTKWQEGRTLQRMSIWLQSTVFLRSAEAPPHTHRGKGESCILFKASPTDFGIFGPHGKQHALQSHCIYKVLTPNQLHPSGCN